MIRSFLTVSSGTLISRLLGFVRDSMIAALLGAGPVADAFLMAFQLVNVVRRLLTEGALNAALVPAWLRVREAGGAAAVATFAGRVLGTVSVTLVIDRRRWSACRCRWSSPRWRRDSPGMKRCGSPSRMRA